MGCNTILLKHKAVCFSSKIPTPTETHLHKQGHFDQFEFKTKSLVRLVARTAIGFKIKKPRLRIYGSHPNGASHVLFNSISTVYATSQVDLT